MTTTTPAGNAEMKAWEAFKKSERSENALKWAMKDFSENGEGLVWAAFDEGWQAAMKTPAANSVELPKIQHILSRDQRDALCAANAFLATLQKDQEGTEFFWRVQKTINEISDMLYEQKHEV